MTSEKCWQQAIELSGYKAYSAHDFYVAEKSAYAAYERRVEEMTNSGQGAMTLGNDEKMLLTTALDTVAAGNEYGCRQLLAEYTEKAQQDPGRYSPLCCGLSAATEYLKEKRAEMGKGQGR